MNVLSRMLRRRIVINDVSKDSPVENIPKILKLEIFRSLLKGEHSIIRASFEILLNHFYKLAIKISGPSISAVQNKTIIFGFL